MPQKPVPQDVDAQALFTLAERLLSIPFPAMPREEVELLLGKLPDDLPVTLPLPDDATLLGSLLHPNERAQIVLDVPAPPAAVIDFYRTQLTASGWQELEEPGMGAPHGFDRGLFQGVRVVFCQGRRGPALTISAHEGAEGIADVRLMVQLNMRHSPCARLGRGDAYESAMALMPRLRAPEGATLEGGGGSHASDNRWDSNVFVQTDLPLADLAAHYEAQLQEADWERLNGEQVGPAAWSNWRFVDELGDPWQGTLFLFASGVVANEYRAYLHGELLP